MTTIPARGAAIRGDDYQHIVGLFYASRILTDPEVESVSIEDADGGAFDDIVVRSTTTSGRPHLYVQVKSGVDRGAVIDADWLVTARTPKGKSPLQHFHRTWVDVTAKGEPFVLRLLSNKNYDHNDPVLKLIDNLTEKIARTKLDALTPRSKGGVQLAAWAKHLRVTLNELKDFLGAVEFVRGESDASWASRTAVLMRNAGLRDDDDAVSRGREMVRGWVTSGAGVRTTNDIRAEVAAKGLLARGSELVLAIHAIDRATLPHRPNAEVDIIELYPDVDPFQRRELLDPAAWEGVVMPKLKAAKKDLEGFKSRKLFIAAHMRLPMYFAVGRTFPDVGGWVLSTDQRDVVWATDVSRETAAAEVVADRHVGDGSDLAVAIALTNDPTDDVCDYIESSGIPIGRILSLSTSGGPSKTSVPGPGWSADWVRRARDHVRAAAKKMRAGRVHLFVSSPAGIALFLGHDWNLLPTTIVYDHLGIPGYSPTITLPG
ncbi:SAVED domain-containing protein [Nocardia araoensis]|uniref:SAVED domain-containing protein n=1 Tax=Nocardia araoensis TaxID=228600 RepID=UPI0002EEFD53|nr:SAVED domain-containing protein [Nocardia araoensis]